MSNRFNLKQRGGAKSLGVNTQPKPTNNNIPPSFNLTDDQLRKLDGYQKVGRQMWAQIPIGTHIRYQRTDGKYRSGGFVKRVSSSGNSMELHNDLNTMSQKYSSWIINFDTILNIWKKPKVYNNSMPPLILPPSAPINNTYMQPAYRSMIASNNDMKSEENAMKISTLESNIKKLEISHEAINKNQQAIMELLVRKFGRLN